MQGGIPANMMQGQAGRGRGGFKYTPNARNAPVQPTSAAIPAQKSVISASSLAALSQEKQKNALGEALFPQICLIASQEHAGKVTGMLLEMDNGELLHLLENPDALKVKVDEAVKALLVDA